MARAFGLPGQHTGMKAHGYFMKGHASGTRCLPPMDTSKLSKACRRAYERGRAKAEVDKVKAALEANGWTEEEVAALTDDTLK